MKRSLEERIQELEEENKKLKFELSKITKLHEKIIIGGVPEHFNIPILNAVEDDLFTKNGKLKKSKTCFFYIL